MIILILQRIKHAKIMSVIVCYKNLWNCKKLRNQILCKKFGLFSQNLKHPKNNPDIQYISYYTVRVQNEYTDFRMWGTGGSTGQCPQVLPDLHCCHGQPPHTGLCPHAVCSTLHNGT